MPEIILVAAGDGRSTWAGRFCQAARRGAGWPAAAIVLAARGALSAAAVDRRIRPRWTMAGCCGPIAVDQFSTTLGCGVLAVGLVFVMLSRPLGSSYGESSEFMGSLLLIVAGLMLISLATDLVMLFVGLELVSIPTYVILFLGRGTNLLEAGTKYFFLSILSSALLLYGFSFLYGASGSTSLVGIERALATGNAAEFVNGTEPRAAAAAADAAAESPRPMASFARLALILIFAGLAFRLTAVPFHFYAPDVYQGTTNPNAGLLAVAPKIAGLVAIGANRLPGHAGAGTTWLATFVGPGDGHDDAGQFAGLVAEATSAG